MLFEGGVSFEKDNMEKNKKIRQNKESVSTLKWIALFAELFFSIPFIGWFILITNLYLILLLVLIHVLTLILINKGNTGFRKRGNVIGLITAFISVIPVIGWLMHVVSLVFLALDIIAYNKNK